MSNKTKIYYIYKDSEYVTLFKTDEKLPAHSTVDYVDMNIRVAF